jgi:hypothetical protein
MNTDVLEIKKENAIAAFKSATAEGRALLTKLFGKENLYEKITDRIKAFADVEEVSGRKLTHRSDETVDEFAYRQIKLIAEVLNEGWVPDWSNQNEYKYFPYFKHMSGFGLSFDGTRNWRTFASVGSRLCFKSVELAECAGKQFADIYNDYLTIKP